MLRTFLSLPHLRGRVDASEASVRVGACARAFTPPRPPSLRSREAPARSRCFASACFAPRTAAEGRLCLPFQGRDKQAIAPLSRIFAFGAGCARLLFASPNKGARDTGVAKTRGPRHLATPRHSGSLSTASPPQPLAPRARCFLGLLRASPAGPSFCPPLGA